MFIECLFCGSLQPWYVVASTIAPTKIFVLTNCFLYISHRSYMFVFQLKLILFDEKRLSYALPQSNCKNFYEPLLQETSKRIEATHITLLIVSSASLKKEDSSATAPNVDAVLGDSLSYYRCPLFLEVKWAKMIFVYEQQLSSCRKHESANDLLLGSNQLN